MEVLRGIYFWVLSFFVSLFFCSLNGLIYYWGKLSKNKIPSKAVHTCTGIWAKTLVILMPGWKVRVLNPELLPTKDQACVFVCNHESMADILVLYFLNRQFRWIAKYEVLKIPFIAQTMRWAGYIAVKRGLRSSHVKAMEESQKWIKNGIPMLFFPEGTRSENGKFQEFKIGAFRLAAECNVPIVPICISGTGQLIKKGTFAPGHANVVMKILPHEMIKATENLEDFTEQVRSKMYTEYLQLQQLF